MRRNIEAVRTGTSRKRPILSAMDPKPDTERPKAQPVQPAPQPERAPSDSFGSWGDPTDMADRQAFDDARRDQYGERPPHY
jgi:hypothetical protein